MSPILPILGIALLVFFIHDAHADTIEVVTGRGNVFILEDVGSLGASGTGDGSGDGESMLDGIGINSRIIHKEYGGSMIYGKSLAGAEESVRPYLEVNSQTRFIVAALDENNPRQIPVPAFYHSYTLGNGSDALRQTSIHSSNILGYEETRRTSGDIAVSLDEIGMTITGSGRSIVKLSDYSGQTLILTGSLAEGTVIRMAHSPYDLMAIGHDPARGFLVYDEPVNPDTGSGPVPVPPRWINPNIPVQESRIGVLVGNTDDSEKSAIFEYLQEASALWYHGKCCKGRYTTTGSATQTVETSLVITGHPSGYLSIVGDRDDPTQMNIRDIARQGAKLSTTHYNRVVDYDYKIYDTLPVKEYRAKLTGIFEEPVSFPQDSGYLVIDSAGGTSSIRASALKERDLLDIRGLEPDTGYKITKGGRTVATGMTSTQGVLSLAAPADHRSPGIGGMLHLYEDSLTHLRSDSALGTIVFDHVNGQMIRLDTDEHRSYNVHAYVKIPVTGSVRISNTSLDERLPLDYLSGDYVSGQSVYFPIIPTYRQVFLSINGIPTYLNIADVLGASGLKIADPVSSTITAEMPSDFVNSIESTAGVITYMIAATDGNAKAHVQATVYGTSEITNSRSFERVPPPPPPPRPIDPLSTWIEVYVNGELQVIDGKTSTQIHFSDEPDEDHVGGSTKTSVFHTARFSYEPVTATGTISVPVMEGDFVEFYFYSRIQADGSIPPVPSGYVEVRRSGSATATSVIEFASINTSL